MFCLTFGKMLIMVRLQNYNLQFHLKFVRNFKSKNKLRKLSRKEKIQLEKLIKSPTLSS